MDKIYVTGHRNPDTDSIVSAMAYATLRNAVGDREYVAARLGHLSDETKAILNRFGFDPPLYITDMRTQVQDLEYDVPPILNRAVTVNRAWSAMEADWHISAIPVTDDDGKLVGMLTSGDIAEQDMKTIADPVLDQVPIFNILSVLEGELLNEPRKVVNSISGRVVIALPRALEDLPFNSKDTILLCGRQPEILQAAVEQGVGCVILCQAELPENLRKMETDTCIISTPFDAYRAARLIFQSAPVSRICRTTGLVCFHLEDRVDEVREQVLKHRESCYPILDENDHVAGVLTRYHLLRPRRKRVVLVDHNEAAQSVPGLEEAEILAIIDHHRLADIQTTNPIYVRNEPVGSTNTIIASMFQDRGLMPSEKMAGMMAAAILSDTVMFKSPTCTDRDRRTAERMARIANVSLEELGKQIFSASLEHRTAQDLIFADYKEFHIAGHNLAVAQVTCMDSPRMLERKEEFLKLMQKNVEEKKLSIMILMLTDVLLEGSQLIYLGDDDTIQQAFGVAPKGNTVFLPHVMSRKKQVIPMLSALWG